MAPSTSTGDHAEPGREARASAPHQAYVILRSTFAVLPIVTGIDKLFFDRLTDWSIYVAPFVVEHSPINVDALMRIADIALAVPQIVLAIALTQAFGPSIESVILALSLTYWPLWARLVYAETRSIRNEIFIESAVALGVPAWRVMVLHILPSIASSIVVRTSIGVGVTILAATTLSFLGLGAPPPTPEWGRMIAESREYLPEAWWYPLAPGMAIFLTVLGCYLFGDGLRDILDPRTRQAL